MDSMKLIAQQYEQANKNHAIWKDIICNVRDFGARGDGYTDDTLAIQRAINYANANGMAMLYFPNGGYRTSGGLVSDCGLILAGENSPEASQVPERRTMGSVILPSKNVSDPVISFIPAAGIYGASGMMKGGGLRSLHILGSDHWNTSANAADRVAVYMERVQTEFTISDLYITGFRREALKMVQVYDGYIYGGRIMYCGTDGTYAALSLEGDATGINNTNAVHVTALHMENNPFMLYANKLARHIYFEKTKFELHAGQSLSSPFFLDNVQEINFMGCQFVTRSATDLTAYANPDLQPHTFYLKGQGLVKFIGNDFTSPTKDGARIFKQDLTSVSRVTMDANTFDNLYAGGGAFPIVVKDSSIITDNRFITKSLNNKRQVIDILGSNNTICDNHFEDSGGGTTPDASSTMFRVAGERNIFDNTILGVTPPKLLGGGQAYIEYTNVRARANDLIQFDINTSTPSVGYNHISGSSDFKVANTVPTSVTDMLDGRDGQILRLMSINGTATTFVHDPAKIIMQAGVNKVLQGFGKFITFVRRAGMWFEI
ncbi:glycosyl hydrolase family 28-related protein [Paenibacillus pasadenensis]|uniref:glycosyl hydrolase family 28-related protein n=1 Tax=Paenibacillus pasadenensis TaxID=217090 RepID=UPI000413D12B|nr:glycosyl hydrolase family 28-related protein [Paenibacillus pasadenensis]